MHHKVILGLVLILILIVSGLLFLNSDKMTFAERLGEVPDTTTEKRDTL